jgi:hypothetical protein
MMAPLLGGFIALQLGLLSPLLLDVNGEDVAATPVATTTDDVAQQTNSDRDPPPPWVLIDTLMPQAPVANGHFGRQVAATGTRVWAMSDPGAGCPTCGPVERYRLDSGGLQAQGALSLPASANHATFGAHVAAGPTFFVLSDRDYMFRRVYIYQPDGALSETLGHLLGPEIVAMTATSADIFVSIEHESVEHYRGIQPPYTWEPKSLLADPPGLPGHINYGDALAALDDWLFVGAPLDDQVGTNVGAVYVFHRQGGNWTFSQTLFPPDPIANTQFGSAIAADGSTVLIGAWARADAGFLSGAAYVFDEAGGTWNFSQKLVAPNAAAFQWFGDAVAIAGDWLLVGAPNDSALLDGAGSAYAFFRDAGTWQFHDQLKAPTPSTGATFGAAVTVSASGLAVIGAPGTHSGQPASGAAYAYIVQDCNSNGIPDVLEPDCNNNGIPDDCDLAAGAAADCNQNDVPDECDIAGGAALDCNSNGVPDDCDLSGGISPDCNGNGVPDECDIATASDPDCNGNDIPDSCDIAAGTSRDCDASSTPDECDVLTEPDADCNSNGLHDACEILDGQASDCNQNGVPDECDVASGAAADCNGNGIPDECDLSGGTSPDCNGNNIPDECDIGAGTDPDCNDNSVPDSCDIAAGASRDCDGNDTPDECDLLTNPDTDCNGNAVPDECDIASGLEQDCNQNEIPDACEIAAGTADDCNGNGVLDECDIAAGGEDDCNANLIPDACELAAGTAEDCNGNGILDECDIASGSAVDCNENGAPDGCELASGTAADCNQNGVLDECDIAAGSAEDCNANGVPDACDILGGVSTDCNNTNTPDTCDLGVVHAARVPVPPGVYGHRVASALSRDGMWFAHARYDDSIDIYRFDGTDWEHDATLPSQSASLLSTAALAIEDGTLAICRSLYPGQVVQRVIYGRLNGTWTLQLDESNSGPAYFELLNTAIGNGFVAFLEVVESRGVYASDIRAYRRSADGWAPDAAPVPSAIHTSFGLSIMLAAHGDRLLIGWRDWPISPWPVVYRYDGRAWQPEQVLTAGDPTYEEVGYSGFIADHVLGFMGRPDFVNGEQGRWIHIFDWNGTQWGPPQDVFVPAALSDFGRETSISGNARTICVGRVDRYTDEAWLRYFEREAGVWTMAGEMKMLPDSPYRTRFERLAVSDLNITLRFYEGSDQGHAAQFGYDCDADGVLDVCQADATNDCNQNYRLDACELAETGKDCNNNGLLDTCEDLILGDFDADGLIGTADLDELDVALRGPDIYIVGDCHDTHARVFDAQADFDIDLADLAEIMIHAQQ